MILTLFFVPYAYATTAQDYLQDGNDAYRRGQYDHAIYAYTKALDIDPNLDKAYDNRGAAYAQEGSLPRAIDDFTMAIAANPKDEQAYSNRGHAYDQKGDLLQAVADYSRVIAIDPLDVRGYKARGFIYYELKQYDKAWDDVFKVEGLGGHVDGDFYRKLKLASDQGK
ncbi:MAG: tetratricopeptide repeat protein [Candidatus Omnitrophica bacterium]|nr:tetratricopeptide repeat protein [Candidatus Omnitrophota bacterium]MDE2009034.1 tetratricopeptide repeat protein [Candidatus Omnitrophota bacterium]MDE2215464.1 tetratricopeptide repeat protein [Candidatus Omnitrophota bacterium]MDE2230876.1 tetratricopeptide repeat protein [Candidatus Omnitrophota bacterium]